MVVRYSDTRVVLLVFHANQRIPARELQAGMDLGETGDGMASAELDKRRHKI
jgi:hypothetical protein